MMKKGIFTLAAILLGLLITFSSCDQTTSTELEESFQTIKEVTPVPGGQNTTMDLQRGDEQDSFFTVSLDGKNETEAWCIEWDEDASFGLNEGTELFSTKGKEEWRALNYFMNIKDDLKAADPELTYREIQVVIWSLIENPKFDVDKIGEYDNISERIYKDGEALFDVQKVKSIVKDVNEFVETNKGKTFWWWYIYVIFIKNNGQTIMTGSSETAFAYGDDYANCFLNIQDLGSNRWGWTNGALSEGSYSFDIYAGAGRCNLSKATLVGKLDIDYTDGTAKVTYRITETSDYTDKLYNITETHLYVGSNPLPTKNGSPTVAPGQYPYKTNHDKNTTEHTYEVTGLTGDIYIVAHADVNGFDPEDD